MDSFIATLREEIARLEADLAKEPKFRRLTKLRDSLAEYLPPPPSVAAFDAPPGFKLVPLTKMERIRVEMTHLLRHRHDLREHRRKLADHLAGLGLLPAEKGLDTLSVYLARWPEFVSDGKGFVVLNEALKTDEAAAAE